MKKFSLALMATVVVMLSIVSSAMAYEVYVPIRTTLKRCEHQKVKTIEFERASDNGGYDVGKAEYHYYNGEVVNCDCAMVVEKESMYSCYISDSTYKSAFDLDPFSCELDFKFQDGRSEKIIRSTSWSPESITRPK